MRANSYSRKITFTFQADQMILDNFGNEFWVGKNMEKTKKKQFTSGYKKVIEIESPRFGMSAD